MKLSLRTQLLGGFLSLVAIMIGLGVFTLAQMATINQNAVLMGTYVVPSVRVIGEIEAVVNHYRRSQLRHIIASSQDEMGDLEAELTTNQARLTELFQEYEPLVSDPTDGAFLDQAQSQWAAYLQTSTPFLSLSRDLKTDDAIDILKGDAEQDINALTTTMGDWTTYNETLSDAALVQAAASYANSQRLVIGVLAVAGLFAVGLGYYLTRSITVAISQIVRAAEGISRGNVNQNITIERSDEIGVMATAFREMVTYLREMADVADHVADGDLTVRVVPRSTDDTLGNAFARMSTNLRELLGHIQSGSSSVASASEQLSLSAEQVNAATQGISQTVQQMSQGSVHQSSAMMRAAGNVEQVARAADGIARGAQEQAAAVQRSAGLVEEMSGVVGEVGRVAQAVAGASAKVTLTARNGVGAVNQTGQGMTKIQARTAQAAAKVKEMGSRSAEIGRIVEVIDDIADKTDMLALNAAVEAARAGEHGRGFAVVADQVRKLSEDAKAATRDIGVLIGRVHETVTEVVAAMEASANEVESGSRLANEASHSLEEILRTAEEAAGLAQQIARSVEEVQRKSEKISAATESVSAVVEENTAAAEEMAASTREVTSAMEGVASIAEESSASSEEISASVEEMAAQVEEVLASSQDLSHLADELRTVIARFKVEESAPTRSEPTPRRNRSGGMPTVMRVPSAPSTTHQPIVQKTHGNGNGNGNGHVIVNR